MQTGALRLAIIVGVALALLGGSAGCDTAAVDVYSASARYFSMFGYLDAARGKQTIRVESLQDSLLYGTDSTEVRVTLRDMERGETVEMTEELVRFSDAVLRNYTTTRPIRPGATYRLVAERLRDGATSQAEVKIPGHAPAVQVNPNAVIVSGIERLGALVGYYGRDGKESLLADTTRRADGSYRVSLLSDQLPPPSDLFTVEAANVSEDWPEYGGPVGEGPAPPVGAESNVENGVGYVGGTITRSASPTHPCAD